MKLDIIRHGRETPGYEAVTITHDGQELERFDSGNAVQDWRDAVTWLERRNIQAYDIGQAAETFIIDTGIDIRQAMALPMEALGTCVRPFPEVDTLANRAQNFPWWFRKLCQLFVKTSWRKLVQYQCNACGCDRPNSQIGIAQHRFYAKYDKGPGECEVTISLRFCRDRMECHLIAKKGDHRRVLAVDSLFQAKHGICYVHQVDCDDCTEFMGFPDLIKGTLRDPNLNIKSFNDIKFVSD